MKYQVVRYDEDKREVIGEFNSLDHAEIFQGAMYAQNPGPDYYIES